MDGFAKRVKVRCFALGGVLVMLVGILVFLITRTETTGGNSVLMGFQTGLVMGLMALTIAYIIRLTRALKDDKQLKIWYSKEHDERLKTIRAKSGMPMLLITSLMMICAAVVAGYYNPIVFYTLVVAAMIQLTAGVLVKLYYLKTM